MGLHEPGSLSLRPIDGLAGEDVGVARTEGACAAGSIDVALARLGADEGDVAYFCFREGRYDIVLRRLGELDAGDPVGHLLWSCGMDPSDNHYRRDLWHRLGIVLGAQTGTREGIRRQLEARRDSERLELLERVVSAHAAPASRAWPAGWQYTAALDEESELLALLGPNGERRIARGVAEASSRPDNGLIVSDGGLAWTEDKSGSANGSAENSDPQIAGLFPAALKPSWNRWLRAEHRLRVAGLCGLGFAVSRDQGAWVVDGVRFDSLLDALDGHDVPSTVPDPPYESARTAYPRAAFAFERALASAAANGLVTLETNSRSGIRAVYDNGREVTGAPFWTLRTP